MENYEKAFRDAKSKYRQNGAGGVSLPNGDTSHGRYAPSADARNNVTMKKGVVYIGGKNVKTTDGGTRHSNIHILHYGEKNEVEKEKKTKKN